jgi:hypothetical protein
MRNNGAGNQFQWPTMHQTGQGEARTRRRLTKPQSHQERECMQMVHRRCVVSRNFMLCAAYAIINMGAEQQTNKNSIRRAHSVRRPPLTSIFIYARPSRRNWGNYQKWTWDNLWYPCRSVCCVRSDAASERGCWKNPAPHAEHHTESGGSTYTPGTRESRVTMRRRELFHLCKCRPCLFCETRRTIHCPSNVITHHAACVRDRVMLICRFVLFFEHLRWDKLGENTTRDKRRVCLQQPKCAVQTIGKSFANTHIRVVPCVFWELPGLFRLKLFNGAALYITRRTHIIHCTQHTALN